MVRSSGCYSRGPYSSPHPRGDGPVVIAMPSSATLFSPTAWGWSAVWGFQHFFFNGHGVPPLVIRTVHPRACRGKIPLLLATGFVFNRSTTYEPNASVDDD